MLPRTLLMTIACLIPLAGQCCADSVRWSTDIEQSLRQAHQSRKMILMKFTADWCGYCKRMERETFSKPAVAGYVNHNFVPVLVDGDKHPDLVRQLNVRGFPALLIVSPEMVILERISGYRTEKALLPELQKAVQSHQPEQATVPTVASQPPVTAPARPVSQPATVDVATQEPRPADAPAQTAMNDQPSAAPRGRKPGQPAFGGLCLSGVRDTRSLVRGVPDFSLQYRGRTLYFSSAEQLEKFRAEPQKYWPEADGYCPVMLLEQGRLVDGKLEYAAVYKGRLWLTHSAEAMKTFVEHPVRYVDAVDRATQAARQRP